MTFMEYGEPWRAHRKHMHQHFRPQVIPDYHPKMMKEVRNLIVSLVDSPAEFLSHYRQ